MMCQESVFIGMTGYHKRRCYVTSPDHDTHKATHPDGQTICWAGDVGKTRIWFEDEA